MDSQAGTPEELLNLPPDLAPEKNFLDRKPSADAFFTAIIFNLFIVLLTVLQWQVEGSLKELAVSGNSVLIDKEYYRLFSAMFIHGDVKHLFSNLFYASILTFLLVGYFGATTILSAAIFFGAVTNYMTIAGMPADQYLLGFSGVVFWFGSTWLTLYFLLMTRYSLAHRIIRTLGVALMIFFPSEAFDPTTSYTAHLYGFLTGILFALILYFIKRKQWQLMIQPNSEQRAQIL